MSEKKDMMKEMEGLGLTGAGGKEHTGLWGKSTRQKVLILLPKENRTDDEDLTDGTMKELTNSRRWQ